MPNQRAEGQKLLTLPVDEHFILAIDKNLPRAGYSNRSQFIRDAIVEKMATAGVKMPKEFTLAPSRIHPPKSKAEVAQLKAAIAARIAANSKRSPGFLKKAKSAAAKVVGSKK
jgi:hypothetical protein